MFSEDAADGKVALFIFWDSGGLDGCAKSNMRDVRTGDGSVGGVHVILNRRTPENSLKMVNGSNNKLDHELFYFILKRRTQPLLTSLCQRDVIVVFISLVCSTRGACNSGS